MRDIKEKPQQPKVKAHLFKERGQSIRRAVTGRMGKLMKDRYRQEQAKGRQEQEPDAAVSAEEQVEQNTVRSFSTVRSAAGRGLDKASRSIRQRREVRQRADGQAEQPHTQTEPASRQPPTPGAQMKQAALKEKKAHAIRGRGGSSEELLPAPSSAGDHAEGNVKQPQRPSAPARPGNAPQHTAPQRTAPPSNTGNEPPPVRGRPQAVIKERPRGNTPAIKTRQAAAAARRGGAVNATAPKPISGPTPKAAPSSCWPCA